MALADEEYNKREVGWLVTKEHTEPTSESRVNWGQLLIHAEETEESLDRLIGHSIFMDKSLTEHMIPDDQKVRWKSYDDDGNPYYDGLVRADWIFSIHPSSGEGGSDLAYNIDRFNMSDVGAVHVYYSVADIISCSKKLDEPSWERFARKHIRTHGVPEDPDGWIEIFG